MKMSRLTSLVLIAMVITALAAIAAQPAKADVVSWYKCIVILPDGSLGETTEPVQAANGTYIQASTYAQGTTQPIQRAGDDYSLTGNIFNYTLLVQRSNIVIDGANFTIQGAFVGFGGAGIYLSGLNNVTIKNVEITRFSTAIQLKNSSNCVIANNTVGNPHNWYLDANGNGIFIENSSHNIISNNVVQGGGIIVSSSTSNIFESNKLYDSGFRVGNPYHPDDLQQYLNSIDTSNQVDDAPVYYLVNQSNLQIDSTMQPRIGYLALINSNNITVKEVTLIPNGPFALFVNTTNSALVGCNVAVSSPGYDGIVIRYSKNNTISRNNLSCPPSSTQNFGLSVWDSSDIRVTENTVTGFWMGILISNSNKTRVASNNVTLSGSGIGIGGFDNEAIGNYIANTVLATSRTINPNAGMGLSLRGNNNFIIGNTLENNGIGLSVDSGSNNRVYQNNFINNTKHVNKDQSTNATWDNGKQGNFWSDYLTKNPTATEVDSSGAGDKPYIIDENNIDHYPLMRAIDPLLLSYSTIAPSPSVPEFPTWMIFALVLILGVSTVLLPKKKR